MVASSLTMAITPFSPHNNPFHRRGNRLREHVASHTSHQARKPGTESRSVAPEPASLTLPPKCIQCSTGSRNGVYPACALPLPCSCQLDKKASACGVWRKRLPSRLASVTRQTVLFHICFPFPPDMDLGFLTAALLLLKSPSHLIILLTISH